MTRVNESNNFDNLKKPIAAVRVSNKSVYCGDNVHNFCSCSGWL